MMKQLIACCGLDCESCDARIATVRDDNELREKTAQLWSKLNNIPEITADTINCMGCRVDGVKTMYCSDMCAIRKCVNEKGFNTCGGCKELDNCQIVGPIFSILPVLKKIFYNILSHSSALQPVYHLIFKIKKQHLRPSYAVSFSLI